MRRFILPVSTLFLVLAGIILISRCTAQSQKPPLLNSYQPWMCGNSPPCWNSIYPGQTSMDEARNILRRAGFIYQKSETTYIYPMRWIRRDIGTVSLFRNLADNNGTVNAIEIEPKDMRLGDAIPLFGPPVSAHLCWTAVPLYLCATVYFSKDVFVNACLPFDFSQETRITPHMEIDTLSFFNYPVPSYRIHARSWEGFVFEAKTGQCGNPPEHQWY